MSSGDRPAGPKTNASLFLADDIFFDLAGSGMSCGKAKSAHVLAKHEQHSLRRIR